MGLDDSYSGGYQWRNHNLTSISCCIFEPLLFASRFVNAGGEADRHALCILHGVPRYVLDFGSSGFGCYMPVHRNPQESRVDGRCDRLESRQSDHLISLQLGGFRE